MDILTKFPHLKVLKVYLVYEEADADNVKYVYDLARLSLQTKIHTWLPDLEVEFQWRVSRQGLGVTDWDEEDF